MKKSIFNNISLTLGILFIVFGFLLSIIPSFIYPNYRLYKGGEDVTYLSSLYDSKYYLYEENDVGISISSTSINIDSEAILNDNNFSLDSDSIMFKFGFNISLNEDISNFEVVEKGELIVSYLEDEDYYFDSEETFSSKEVVISSLNDINIEITKFIVILNEKEEVEVISSFSSFYLEVYKD